MDVIAFLSEVCALPGHPGMEKPVALRVAEEFRKYTDDVTIDALGNVTAAMGPKDAPPVLLCAHMDEVGMIVTGFDERGGLYMQSMGGVDPRILPGMEVTVHGREPVFGVIGVKPPHLTQGDQKAPTFKELVVDTGYPRDKIMELVRIGDPISFAAPLIELKNGRIASKTFDDRACIASLLLAMEQLSNVKLNCRALFTATVAEEVGARGARTASNRLHPVMGFALDVTHGPTPGVDRGETISLDAVAVAKGPLIHPALYKRVCDTAKRVNVSIETELAPRFTGTDGDNIQTSLEGIPTAVISLPLSYMHTTVETISVRTLEETGRLLAGFLEGVGADWEEWLCYED